MALLLILFVLTVIQNVSVISAEGHPYKSEHCIKMTSQKEKEIDDIVARLTDFINNITSEFDDYDIRLVKLDIESHSENETEEKELKLQLTVNDCTEYEKEDSEEESENSKEIDTTSEIPVTESTTEKVIKPDLNSQECSCPCKLDEKVSITKDSENAYVSSPAETVWFFDLGKGNDETDVDDQGIKVTYTADASEDEINPDFMTLDLSEFDQNAIEILDKRNKPLLVFVQRKLDQDEFIFL